MSSVTEKRKQALSYLTIDSMISDDCQIDYTTSLSDTGLWMTSFSHLNAAVYVAIFLEVRF